MSASYYTIAHGIINLNELLRKYFVLFKPIVEQTARSTFIQLTVHHSNLTEMHFPSPCFK